jgi:hypothetical protein
LALPLARSVFHYLGTRFPRLGFGNGHVFELLYYCAKSLPLTEPNAKTVGELLMTSRTSYISDLIKALD